VEEHHLLVETKFAQLVIIVLLALKKKDNALQVCTAQEPSYQHPKGLALRDISAIQVQQLLNPLMEYKEIYVHQDSIALREVHHQ